MARGFVHISTVVGARGAGQDRVGVRELDDGIVIALADGAGGTGGGAQAAQAVIDAVLAAAPTVPAWSSFLAELDPAVMRLGGETTAIALSVTRAEIVGAAVGDSGAWIIRDDGVEDLTAAQERKPLLGGGCMPVEVRSGSLAGGTLLVASDGLLKYAREARIASVVRGAELAAAAHALVELVRLRSGALQDDVSIILCRES